jgi:hypothetical protein
MNLRFRTESTDLIHRALTSIVQLLGLRASPKDNEASLVDSASDLAIDIFLTSDDRLLQELTLRREVQTVVKDLSVVESDELITKSPDLTVKNKTLEIDVCRSEAGQARGLVAATRLETNEAVLNDVDTSNTVSASDSISLQEKLNGICDGLSLAGYQLLWQTLLEHQSEILWGIWCLQWVHCQFPHIRWSGDIWILQDTSLITAVCQVLIHAPRLALCAADWDSGLLSIVEEIVAAGESVVEFGETPWGDDLDGRLEGVECKFKTDLVISFTSAAVRDSNASFLLCDFDLGAGNDGASEGRSCGWEVY